jgi:hypothetical protein
MRHVLNYSEDIRQSMIPIIKIITATPMVMEPFTVQSGLLNIKEADGPTIRLLCNVNIIPSISNIRAATPNDLPMYFSFTR